MKGYTFFVRWSERDDQYVASVLEWPTLAAYSASPEHALTAVQHALTAALVKSKNNPHLPAPSHSGHLHPAAAVVTEILRFCPDTAQGRATAKKAHKLFLLPLPPPGTV